MTNENTEEYVDNINTIVTQGDEIDDAALDTATTALDKLADTDSNIEINDEVNGVTEGFSATIRKNGIDSRHLVIIIVIIKRLSTSIHHVFEQVYKPTHFHCVYIGLEYINPRSHIMSKYWIRQKLINLPFSAVNGKCSGYSRCNQQKH